MVSRGKCLHQKMRKLKKKLRLQYLEVLTKEQLTTKECAYTKRQNVTDLSH